MTREEFQTERTRIISEMLDNPDEYGIYPTTKCFEQLDALFDSLSLPPAEGAEQRIRVRNILQDFYRRGEYELEQAEEDIMRLFQQQPTAEGAEQLADLKQYMTNLLYYVADPANVPADQLDHWVEEMVNGIDEYFKSKQPTAEGAEENRNRIDGLIKKHISIDTANFEFCAKNNTINGSLLQGIRDVVNEYATLHAQRIAEKKYADTEADGYVFCGKCGKMKEI